MVKVFNILYLEGGTMEKIKKQELKNIYGGGFNLGIAAIIVAGITFIIGLLDGYVRPLACNK